MQEPHPILITETVKRNYSYTVNLADRQTDRQTETASQQARRTITHTEGNTHTHTHTHTHNNTIRTFARLCILSQTNSSFVRRQDIQM
jgi:hypothetical protein